MYKLGEDYSVQLFLQDMLVTFREFMPYVLTAAIAIGVINWTVGAVINAVSMRNM